MTSSAIVRVLNAVATERDRQDHLWGEQNPPDGTGTTALEELCNGASSADQAKLNCAEGVKYNNLTWSDILWEEMAEALEETDPDKLAIELTQVAAVACAWIECLNRRKDRANESTL